MRHETKQKVINAIKIFVALLLVVTVFTVWRVSLGLKFYDYRHADTDSDGTPDFEDNDLDGDGLPNFEDDDADNNGVDNIDDILDAVEELAARKYSYDRFPSFLGKMGRKMRYFRPVDAVIIPFEKAGLYLDLVNSGGMIPDEADRIKTPADLHGFVQMFGRFETMRTKFDLPPIGAIAFFGHDFCGLVIDAENVDVELLVCDRSIGLAKTTVRTMINSGHRLTEYGILDFP